MNDRSQDDTAILTPNERYARLTELADAGDSSEEALQKLVRLLFDPDAQLGE